MSQVKTSEKGIASIGSKYSVEETVDRLEASAKSHGMMIFARIDFSGDAGRAGLKMPDTRMLIFGNPKRGTPLIIAAPSLALDLPLKVLVFVDETGKVWASYNTPEYLKARHKIPDDLLRNTSGVGALVESMIT